MFAATIGYFDGVHIGHQQVLRRLCEEASARGLTPMVVTFGNHPLSVVRPGSEPVALMTTEEKVATIKSLGISEVAVLNFTPQMMQQSAYDFMREVLRDELGVRMLMIGYDNRFGRRNPEETFESYVLYGKELGIEVVLGPRPEECGLIDGTPVSSSLIRKMMAEGDERYKGLLAFGEVKSEK